jgi:hypothetical protein
LIGFFNQEDNAQLGALGDLDLVAGLADRVGVFNLPGSRRGSALATLRPLPPVRNAAANVAEDRRRLLSASESRRKRGRYPQPDRQQARNHREAEPQGR